MQELDQENFDWLEWDAVERDTLYMMEKLLGTEVTDQTFSMKVEAFKEAVARDPNFKQDSGAQDGGN